MGIRIDILKKVALSERGDYHHLRPLSVFIDSRKHTPNGLFIPIVGERFDGHDFLEEAIKNGAVCALWQKDRPVPAQLAHDFPLFFVADTTKALQQIASERRREVDPTVVAVTGSNGKTTTKDMIASVLATSFKTQKNVGNLNNHIGLPLTLCALNDDCEVIVVEMGMNHFGEIQVLSTIAEPDIAIITNIGESHIEFLGSREGIAKAKLEITEGLKDDGWLIVDGDEALLRDVTLKQKDARVSRCGFGARNDWVISDVQVNENGTAFKINGEALHIPIMGRHNVKNAAYAFVVARRLGMAQEAIRTALTTLKITGMRLEADRGPAGTLLINDAYNASPTSMKAALETLSALTRYKRKVAVLGDMYELGHEEKAMHEQVADHITDHITHLVTIGDKGVWIAEAARKKSLATDIRSFKTKEEALPYLQALATSDTVMLFKASRRAELETLVASLKGGNHS
ncbi:UDP-N-acetylmuramoyl-tripeptide--D-alanyl-D-alanine ligase [Tuberibacillus calidus]|uniref:UDP-N-acetylmuramoyl-tripeptide--D-alanyl-D- alanine ligase n=1 Tax=Tuberibacillus calidus TaxID=340097 RepID=UPI00041384D6|nr:UDP-N-acetylmuramoyl-tripeptide--D-alanyl-D-alanine ligase [Tuberibacillus calidus]